MMVVISMSMVTAIPYALASLLLEPNSMTASTMQPYRLQFTKGTYTWPVSLTEV